MTQSDLKYLMTMFAYEFYFRAITIHKTHKNKRILIEKGGFLEAIYKDKNSFLVIIKSTQTGISEYLTIRALSRAEKGKGVLYVLPTFDLKSQFVKERIDKPMMFSPYYRNLMKDPMLKRRSESVSLKQIGYGSIALVGSNTPNAFISYPADDIIIDEYDQCNQENLNMAEERQSASEDKTTTLIGNPTITGFGLDLRIQETDDKHWKVKCSHCNKHIETDFFNHIAREVEQGVWILRDEKYDKELSRDIYAICHKCRKPYDRKASGQWVSKRNNDPSGYSVSKMFSTFVTVKELVKRFESGLLDDKKMERFYNGDLGLAYQPKGSKIFPDMLDSCVEDYSLMVRSSRPCIMGVDVGKYLHVIIAQIVTDGRLRVVYINAVHEQSEIEELYKRFNCKVGVVDGLPETRLSKSLCGKFRGFFRWFKHSEKTSKVDPKTKIVHAYRTEMLDDVKSFVVSESILLPRDARKLPDFYDQVCAPTRLFDEKGQRFIWDEGSKADHYCFSLAFLILAKKIITMIGKK